MITATFFSFSTNCSLSVVDNFVSITDIQNVIFPTTLRGITTVHKERIVFDTLFDDTTILPFESVIGYGTNAVLSGLVTFTVDSSAVIVDKYTGEVTLLKNAPTEVTVMLGWFKNGDKVSKAVRFFANLDPAVGDMDLGSPFGSQFPHLLTVGSTLTVEMRINTGLNNVDDIDLKIEYNPLFLLSVNAVVATSTDSFGAGSFLASLHSPEGEVSLGGHRTAPTQSATLLVATVTFTVRDAAAGQTVSIIGTVNNIAANQVDILGKTKYLSNASVGSFTIANLTRRRDDRHNFMSPLASLNSFSKFRRSSTCAIGQIAPCADCVGEREAGDANGDCLFDIKDVGYISGYVVGLQPLTNAAIMDANLDGKVDAVDAYFLLRVNFKFLLFIQKPTIILPTQANNCNFQIHVSPLQRGNRPAIDSQTFIYFDIESTDSHLRSELEGRRLTKGSFAILDKGAGYNGQIWQAVSDGAGKWLTTITGFPNVSNFGVSIIQINTDAAGNISGIGYSYMTLNQINQAYTAALSIKLQNIQFTAASGYTPMKSWDASFVQSMDPTCLFQPVVVKFVQFVILCIIVVEEADVQSVILHMGPKLDAIYANLLKVPLSQVKTTIARQVRRGINLEGSIVITIDSTKASAAITTANDPVAKASAAKSFIDEAASSLGIIVGFTVASVSGPTEITPQTTTVPPKLSDSKLSSSEIVGICIGSIAAAIVVASAFIQKKPPRQTIPVAPVIPVVFDLDNIMNRLDVKSRPADDLSVIQSTGFDLDAILHKLMADGANDSSQPNLMKSSENANRTRKPSYAQATEEPWGDSNQSSNVSDRKKPSYAQATEEPWGDNSQSSDFPASHMDWDNFVAPPTENGYIEVNAHHVAETS